MKDRFLVGFRGRWRRRREEVSQRKRQKGRKRRKLGKGCVGALSYGGRARRGLAEARQVSGASRVVADATTGTAVALWLMAWALAVSTVASGMVEGAGSLRARDGGTVVDGVDCALREPLRRLRVPWTGRRRCSCSGLSLPTSKTASNCGDECSRATPGPVFSMPSNRSAS